MGVALLGSTGSIGRQTLDVIDAHSDRLQIVSLAARHLSPAFQEQVARYRPVLASLSGSREAPQIGDTRFVHGIDGLTEAATLPAVDVVVVATSGHDAILPTIRAIEQGKIIAIANKETLVCAGEIIMPLAMRHSSELRPVDSEHSAIWQAIGSAPTSELARIIITASGGPFRTTPAGELAAVTAAQALLHPTWSMGGKITIDSATLMNKGLEVIEAHWLFDMPYEQIEVLVHPESIVHSIVEFVDGSQLAQLGMPDMRLPIQLALSHPHRWPRPGSRLDLASVAQLRFAAPDLERFPALRLAREAGAAGNTYPTVLSAADDEAVAAFLAGIVRFPDIAAVVQHVLDLHVPTGPLDLDAILATDAWARNTAKQAMSLANE